MIQAAKATFQAIETMAITVDTGASALLHLAEWAEESAGAFADEARADRYEKVLEVEARLKELELKHKPQEQNLIEGEVVEEEK